jgi:3-phenylpropionate/trans-cinnamate dioxygenase ferredoxin reductase component
MTDSIVIVGASLAGLHAARTLRHEGFTGRISVVDADPHTPYDRPPLSKQVLAGEWDIERIVLPAATEDLDLDWHLDTRATGLDRETGQVLVEGPGGVPGSIAYDQLVLATGAAARRLPGTEGIDGIHVLRSLDDAVAVRSALDAGARRVVVIGAGFIGAEVAATCRGRGLDVTVVEALPVPLERALGAEMGAVCARLHEEHGVDVRLGSGVDHFTTETRDDRPHVTGVVLADGSTVEADVVVVGIGVAVNTGWLEGSGLALDDGVVCDETLLAAPGIVAAGDLARYPSARFDQVLRVEHWEHAVRGGEAAALRLLAEQQGATPEVFDPVPWFWSDQYDRKIQLAGRPGPDDEVAVVHGATAEFRFVALYRRGDRLVGVLGMNRPRHVIQLRALLEEQASWDAALVRAGEL